MGNLQDLLLWHVVEQPVCGKHDQITFLNGHAHERRVVWRFEASVRLVIYWVTVTELIRLIEAAQLLWAAERDMVPRIATDPSGRIKRTVNLGRVRAKRITQN